LVTLFDCFGLVLVVFAWFAAGAYVF